MHSRATDRRSASKCQGKWPDQAVNHPSDGSHPPSRTWAFQPIQKTATIHVSSGFIWGIPGRIRFRSEPMTEDTYVISDIHLGGNPALAVVNGTVDFQMCPRE